MKKYLKIITLIILLLFIFYMIYDFTLKKYLFYSSHIEIQIPIFAKIEEKDTHGGFHGDGETFVKIYLSDKQTQKFISKINKNLHWQELPMPKLLQNCASNSIDEGIEIPFVNNGYWFFLNRQSKVTDKYNYNEIVNIASSNYSIAIFDTASNVLYYYALDT